MKNGYKLTTNGREILAACMALKAPLDLTRALVGSGKVSEDTNLADVHELLQYVTTGYIGDRRHEEDRLYLDILYQNDSKHADVGAFMLAEFIVYAINPATGREEDFLYATMGDYLQSIPPYTIGFPTGIWQFPIVLVVSDEIIVNINAPAGMVTYAELIKLLNSRAAGAAKIDITIPASGWIKDTDTNGAYAYCRDIASTDITEDMIPQLTVYPRSLNGAADCGLCPTSRTLPGLLRVYAKSIPNADIIASLTLLDTAPQHGGLSSSAVVARLDIEIPTVGWEDNDEANNPYALRVDILDTAIESNLIPALTIVPEHIDAAGDCGLSTYSRTLSGALRVYADQVPKSPIRASLALLGVTQSITGNIPEEGGDVYALPVASASQLGLMKVGDGLHAAKDGTVSVIKATDEEVERILEEVYPTDKD